MKLFQSILLSSIAITAVTANVFSSTGFINCIPNPQMLVNSASVSLDSDSGILNFQISATNLGQQTSVTAELTVTAYGAQVLSKSLNFCTDLTTSLCPVPANSFWANASQPIPPEFRSSIPQIAFTVPDLDVQATLNLVGADQQQIGCVTTGFTNGNTIYTPAVTYAAGAIALVALVTSGFASLSSSAGSPAPTISFSLIMGWFQSISQNGMLSVNYPPVYRAFTKNFAFFTGLIPWGQMQVAIDNFRAATGGNLQTDSVEYLQGATSLTNSKRGLQYLSTRQISGGLGTGTASSNTLTSYVDYGIAGYVERQNIPQGDAFMTVLITFSLVLSGILVVMLFIRATVEAWGLWFPKSLPKKLISFRRRYWILLARSIINLIYIHYGAWTMWCIFQFITGDSWGPKLLSAVSLALYTALIAFLTTKIIIIGKKGDSSLYHNQKIWDRYSPFYNPYKETRYWAFVPYLIYTLAKNCVLAGAQDNTPSPNQGFAQTLILIIIESGMLAFLIWKRPFVSRKTQLIAIFTQLAAIISAVGTLLFVGRLGLSRQAQTVVGMVIIAVQASTSGLLGVLTTVIAVVKLFRGSPHHKKQKEDKKHAYNKHAHAKHAGKKGKHSIVETLDIKGTESHLSHDAKKSHVRTSIVDSDHGSTKEYAPSVSVMEV